MSRPRLSHARTKTLEARLVEECVCTRRGLQPDPRTSTQPGVIFCARCGAAAELPRTVAWVHGRAVPFGERCWIREGDGREFFEMFAPYAFDSMHPTDVRLTMNHSEVSSIPCRLGICAQRDGLDFVAPLPESPQTRVLLARQELIAGVSIRFGIVRRVPEPSLARQGIEGYVVEEAELREISIVLRPNRPSWHSTHCTVTRV